MFSKLYAFLLISVFFVTAAFAGNYEVGNSYHGFKLLEKKFVKEVNTECFYFMHEKSGAHLFKIASDDANKTFTVTFKTPPNSDYGTPHIIEHSVLNGSKNFPVKSPFDVLSQGSLNTFLNALTSSDWTMYPIASMNDKDYFNLMHVYLDAVFYPLIYSDPRIFKQEGWHREMEDVNGEVTYKGVVYNEMKGAFSSPSRELNYQIYKNLFPENCYSFSSGGYPAAIPNLTYQGFIAFHKKYYHPSNSRIFLYGNADLDKELEFIDTKYLSSFDNGDGSPEIPFQKPFDKMKEVSGYYPVSEGSETKDQTYLSLSFVSGKNTDKAHVMALEVLADVLFNSESAPVRLALQKAGIGKEVSAGNDNIQQNVFTINVQNANPEEKDKFYSIIMDELKKAVKNGLDKEAVEGTLNRMEFRLREGNDAQKGLSYNFASLTGWLFEGNPFLTLEYEKPLAEVKTALSTNMLETIIKTEMIDNPFSLLLVLEPKPGLEKENNTKIEKELEDYKNSLSDDQKKQLVKETKDLVEYQQRSDAPEALATIPMLELSDINPKADWYDVKQKNEAGIKVLERNDFTNNVLYTRLYFDLRVLPEELIPYAALLAEVMGSLDTKNYTFAELDKSLNINTGGFGTFLTTYLENHEDESLIPKFIVDSKSMNDKIGKMFELLSEIVTNTKYVDKERLKAVIERHQSRLDSRIKRDGLTYATERSLSYFSKRGLFNEITGGYEYYKFVTDLSENFNDKSDEITKILSQTAELLFNKNNLIVSVSCDEAAQKDYYSELSKFVKSLTLENTVYSVWVLKPVKKNEGLLAASKVQYVVQGYDFQKLGYKWNGKLRVLEQILSSDWLQTQIRVIGGAYGGWCNIDQSGQAYFASYRDPNLKETLTKFSETPIFVEKFEADENQMLRFILGTISGIDRPLTASQKCNVAVRNYFEKISLDEVQKDREAVISTTAEDIRNMRKFVEDILTQKSYCVYGSEEKLKSEKDLFDNLVKISK